MTVPSSPFHLAFPVRDLESTRRFYAGLLGCREGRSAPTWIDFDFFGHQISAHIAADRVQATPANEVDGDAVPVRHFGVVLPWHAWEMLVQKLRSARADFLIGPRVRFEGEVGEQATAFVVDPSGNALEFKAFRDPERLFARGSESG